MDLQVIPRDEALRLLESAPVGRIVFTLRALPAVLPVNFILDGDAIVVRTSPGSKLTAAVRNAIVAFEVDEIDPETRTGWSVLVTGRAREVRDPEETARLRARLQPWASGEREHFIRIPADLVSGRRLVIEPVATGPPLGTAAP